MTGITNKSAIKVIAVICMCSVICITAWFLSYNYLTNNKILYNTIVFNILFTILVTGLISIANTQTVNILQKKLPWQKGNKKRFVLELLITSFNAAIIISIMLLVLYSITPPSSKPSVSPQVIFFQNITIALIVNAIVISITEASCMLKGWKNALIESEALRRDRAEAQYQALKNQVNPHFLFNSLNALASLIRNKSSNALPFIEKFSNIYRYVLEVTDLMVVELKVEIDFIVQFIYLHQIRYGENLKINININNNHSSCYILPLSLQLIVENAIKHNEISSDNPLTINMYIQNNSLVVSNNLQLKKNITQSTGIGLKNLIERYKHFSDTEPVFYIENNIYFAILPFIND